MFDLAFLWSDTVIFPVIFFVMGLGTTLAYLRITGSVKERRYHADETVVEAVVSEYTRRLQEYDKMLADLKMRMDLVEIRAGPKQAEPVVREIDQISHISRASHSPQHHTQRVTERMTVTPQPPAATIDAASVEVHNGTSHYILRLLAERPRTSREVQLATGRSREHTARLLKKLTESKMVERNVQTKPFTYIVTDLGRQQLHEKAGLAAENRLP